MEPERVGSFGCRPHTILGKLKLSRSSSNTNLTSPKSSSMISSSSPSSSSSSRSKTTSTSKVITTRSREDDYKHVFRRFDTDNNGKISAIELRSYFGSIGEYMSHEDAQAVITDIDTDGDNLIDFRDFLRLMREGKADADLKAAFEKFELEKGCGRITPKSLQRVLSRLGEAKSYDECAAMIQVYDTDGKGELHFHEFQLMMMAN